VPVPLMRLIIEEMHQGISENLRLGHSLGSLIAVQTSRRVFVVSFYHCY
jgi:hypothetical protein